jgi:hypothetical protein
VPHSWGALLLIPKGQPFTAAQFRREVPLFRGQPADKHLADLAACRDESYDALFASWLKSKSVERSSSGMTLVASSADGSRELEMRAMRQGSPSHQGPRGILRSGHPAAREAESSVLLRDALLLHQRVRTEKELETITNAVFASAVFGDE